MPFPDYFVVCLIIKFFLNYLLRDSKNLVYFNFYRIPTDFDLPKNISISPFDSYVKPSNQELMQCYQNNISVSLA